MVQCTLYINKYIILKKKDFITHRPLSIHSIYILMFRLYSIYYNMLSELINNPYQNNIVII